MPDGWVGPDAEGWDDDAGGCADTREAALERVGADRRTGTDALIDEDAADVDRWAWEGGRGGDGDGDGDGDGEGPGNESTAEAARDA